MPDLHAVADILDDLPNLLRTERERRNLSLRAAAAEQGKPSSMLKAWEEGENSPSIHNAAILLRWIADSRRQR